MSADETGPGTFDDLWMANDLDGDPDGYVLRSHVYDMVHELYLQAKREAHLAGQRAMREAGVRRFQELALECQEKYNATAKSSYLDSAQNYLDAADDLKGFPLFDPDQEGGGEEPEPIQAETAYVDPGVAAVLRGVRCTCPKCSDKEGGE